MSNIIDKILKRSGTGQAQRFVEALDPTNFKLQDFSVEDWILFAYNFAKNVNYFSTNDDKKPSGDWEAFFHDFDLENTAIPDRSTVEYEELKNNITEVLTNYKEAHNLTPHLTLFICFLQLLEFSKERFNTITKRHLDFYYKSILQVDKLAATPDQVHVLFELARKSSEEQIVTGTALNAQKDAEGNQRIYKTTEELIVNKAKVSDLKTVYNGAKFTDPKQIVSNPQELRASSVANTLDGLELPLLEENPYWYPFGYTSAETKYNTLENAEIGFAISSPMLNLKEGLRKVAITIGFTSDPDLATVLEEFTPEVLQDIITIYGSGDEGWIGPLEMIIEEEVLEASVSIDINTEVEIADKEVEKAQEKIAAEEKMITEKLTNTQLKLVFQLDRDTDALVNYNQEFLLKKYNTNFPVVRFMVDVSKAEGHTFYRAITQKVVENITVKVDVKDVKNVLLENDFGVLKSAKPFYPFTTQPVKKSNFYINYPEAFSKNWNSIDINLKWKNTPDDFKEWYSAYLQTQRKATQKSVFEEQMKTINSSQLIIESDEDFTAEKAVYHKAAWDIKPDDQILFSKGLENDFESNIQFLNTEYNIEKSGPLRLSLHQSFLHQLYPRIYALALTSTTNPPIPNEPYTPLAENISLNYVASESINIKSQVFSLKDNSDILPENNEAAYSSNRIKLFQEHPFGQEEEHNYLEIIKRKRGINGKNDTKNIETHLLPKYCKGGSLFIGLEDAEASETVSLLIQVLEGSENPLVPSFQENEAVDWAVLCNGKWKDLKEYIIANNTGNFLSSGIIKISIPAEATKDNTLLPENRIWLRARMHKSYDAVCKVIHIHAQAVEATFENDSNELSHLAEGLPAETIKKLITRIPQVKGLQQPYVSFNGKAEESDLNFYRRISERLRHKNRAITLWDYEHLILQEFTEIYKVKCLNHTSDKSFLAAGEVTIVVIPDTVNKNVFDIFEPRVSTGVLNKVEAFINQLNSKHVTAKVINPNYEKVKITLQVQFYKGLDKSFYAKKLDEDIIKFLSPWAYDKTKEIAFGITLHRSVLIDYLEKLDYVDFLQNVTMRKEGSTKAETNITPSSPKSILVSEKKHSIDTNLTACGESLTEEINICQA
ncbi:baseplate J/gp47 family protein [Polaribacter sp.]|uniref:baseplate J/gp47 family protein n=1 Tax=Polaribacter sp. TaxID=1920175 RepID=UPI003EF90FFA